MVAGKEWENLKGIRPLVPELETFFWPDDVDHCPYCGSERREMRESDEGERSWGMKNRVNQTIVEKA